VAWLPTVVIDGVNSRLFAAAQKHRFEAIATLPGGYPGMTPMS